MKKKYKVSIPPIKSIQAFEQTAHFGSIVKAAESLDVTASAISHQISTLESFLGKKLFYRNGRGVTLTDTGEKYLTSIEGALHTINVATSNVIFQKETESLRIHSSPSFGLLYLLPKIEKFKQAHPHLLINLTCSYEDVKFNLEQVDLDIRHGAKFNQNLSVIPIKNEAFTVLAAPRFLHDKSITTPRDLLNYNLIRSESTFIQWREWFAHHDISLRHDHYFSFCFDRSYMSFEAAKQGLGFILESHLLAEDLIKRGELVPVFDDTFDLPVNAHFMVYPFSHKDFPRVQYFVKWLKKELGQL